MTDVCITRPNTPPPGAVKPRFGYLEPFGVQKTHCKAASGPCKEDKR